MAQLIELASTLGYEHLHIRPAMRQSGRWSTPISGGLGVGYPDLSLARPATATRPGRFVLVECKAEDGRLSPPQKRVHDVLRAAGVEVYTWRPSELESAARVLAR
jgi:hypothetical protein